jgi:hypothetical protein
MVAAVNRRRVTRYDLARNITRFPKVGALAAALLGCTA